MDDRDERLIGRLDRLGVERLARAEGLPEVLAAKVAAVVAGTGLREDRRAEVFRELVAHFEDGLAAGRSAEELAADFGDGRAAGRLVAAEKRVVTPESAGGSGRSDGVLTTLFGDVRYAFRRLLARPLFTAIAVLSLAIGIGANSAIFTLINEVILRKPPLERPEELVEIYKSGLAFDYGTLSYPDYEDVARLDDVFSDVVASRMAYGSRIEAEETERIAVQLVSGNYFEALGLKVPLGRTIVPQDAPAVGEGAVVVLTERYWRRAFGGDPAVVGRTIRLSGREFTIIGVTGADFQGGFRTMAIDLIVPVTMLPVFAADGLEDFTVRRNQAIFARARLKPGVSLAQAAARLSVLASEFRAANLDGWKGQTSLTLLPTSQVILFPAVDQLLQPIALVLMVVVGLVLVIACANLAGFLLARAVDRRKEIAVRVAIGATRGRLITQLLVETVLLAFLGGLVGLILGQLGLRAALASDLPLPIPLGLDLSIDGRVLAFSVAVSLLAGIAFGLAPALHSTRLELASVIRDESTGGGRSKGRLRQGLIMAQMTVSVVLLIGAGLFVRSVANLKNVDPGFGRGDGVLLWLSPPAIRTQAERIRQLDLLVREVARQPGVTSVGLITNIHLNLLGTSSTGITVDGVEPPPGEEFHEVDRSAIDTGFVAAAGLRLVEGRNFTAVDTDSGAPRLAIVNEAFAAKFFPGRSAVGRRFRDGDSEVEIVGVVNTAKIRSLAERDLPFIYENGPVDLFPWIVVSSRINDETQLAALRRVVQRVDPEMLLMEARTFRRHFSVMALPLEVSANLLTACAVLALVMASIGLYGTISYAVAQRSREMGIRLSLGAPAGAVVRMLMWDGLKLVVVGAGIGLVVGVGLGRMLEGMLFGVTAFDPLTILLVPAALVSVAVAAAWLPARRAGRIDPVRAIRAE